jgi:hypothetical protein
VDRDSKDYWKGVALEQKKKNAGGAGVADAGAVEEEHWLKTEDSRTRRGEPARRRGRGGGGKQRRWRIRIR